MHSKIEFSQVFKTDVGNSILFHLPSMIPAIYQNWIVSDWQTKSDGKVRFDHTNSLHLAKDGFSKKKKLLILMLLFSFAQSEQKLEMLLRVFNGYWNR